MTNRTTSRAALLAIDEQRKAIEARLRLALPPFFKLMVALYPRRGDAAGRSTVAYPREIHLFGLNEYGETWDDKALCGDIDRASAVAPDRLGERADGLDFCEACMLWAGQELAKVDKE